jgi:hypothetical protein
MPRGFMDDPKGEVADKEVHKCALGDDMKAIFFPSIDNPQERRYNITITNERNQNEHALCK